jgi:hypothetical protein
LLAAQEQPVFSPARLVTQRSFTDIIVCALQGTSWLGRLPGSEGSRGFDDGDQRGLSDA